MPRLIPTFALLALWIGVAGCDSAGPSNLASALAEPAPVQTGQRCVLVNFEGEANLGAPVVISLPTGEVYAGLGGLPGRAMIGPYEGLLSSVVVTQEQAGNGADKITLVHHFVEDGTGDAFWTDDRAVCSPAGRDPSTCLINANFEVVGGTGKFEGASGRLHNRGLATFFPGPVVDEETGRVLLGSLEVNLRGRVCGDGL